MVPPRRIGRHGRNRSAKEAAIEVRCEVPVEQVATERPRDEENARRKPPDGAVRLHVPQVRLLTGDVGRRRNAIPKAPLAPCRLDARVLRADIVGDVDFVSAGQLLQRR